MSINTTPPKPTYGISATITIEQSIPAAISGRIPIITKCERKAPKFIYGDISSLKNNDSISLFFIVLYF